MLLVNERISFLQGISLRPEHTPRRCWRCLRWWTGHSTAPSRSMHSLEKRSSSISGMNPHIHTFIHTYIYTYIYTHAHIHTYIHRNVTVSHLWKAHTYIHIHTHTHTHAHIHTHSHTHTHSHKHTHTQMHWHSIDITIMDAYWFDLNISVSPATPCIPPRNSWVGSSCISAQFGWTSEAYPGMQAGVSKKRNPCAENPLRKHCRWQLWSSL